MTETGSMDQALIFDEELIAKYDTAGPRYTSYPTAPHFSESFGADAYAERVGERNALKRPLSLYFHIPFCDTVCFFCGCNKVATKDRTRPAPYLERLHKEIRLQAELYGEGSRVEQLHLGGGTPTFISHQEMRQLFDVTREHFQLLDDDTGEYSIEIDPREARGDTIALLRELGLNRMSLGVQDFDDRVQRAVNRIQSREQTLEVLNAARSEGFRSVSVDLIYGLPLQSRDSFARTLDEIIEVNPDRISVFNYAHLPERFKPQRRINEAELPNPAEKLEILKMAFDHLGQAGYVYIGMDHFAKPADELAQAQRDGTLYRNFQGYSTHANCDLIGLGVTSIGMLLDTYQQNRRTIDEYNADLDRNHLPVFRGMQLSRDDQIRRAVISDTICHFRLDTQKIEQEWQIDFSDYFADELAELHRMSEDGLVAFEGKIMMVMPRGRLLVRNICMVFDAYLRNRQEVRYSKVI